MSWKARTYLKRGLVKLIGQSPELLFFEVKEYSIRIPKKGSSQKGSCTCESFSIWNVGKHCSHITACRMWMEAKDLE